MWRAILGDLVKLSELSIVTTWDRRLPNDLGPDRFREDQSRLEVRFVEHPDEEVAVFRESCRSCDASYVIAPELDDELSRRVAIASQGSPSHRNLNADIRAIDLCGDKWALFKHLLQEGIPTIPTVRLIDRDQCRSLPWPRVLKLRMGAGSQSMQLIDTPELWENATESLIHHDRLTEVIAQPLIRGTSHSMGAVIDRGGGIHLLPLADQRIDVASSFSYLGGRIPSERGVPEVTSLITRVLSSIPGLRGYIGVDLIIPDSSPTEPLIVEINPRLTTSYVGYRRLCRENLAALWIGDAPVPRSLHWHSEAVDFSAAGEFR